MLVDEDVANEALLPLSQLFLFLDGVLHNHLHISSCALPLTPRAHHELLFGNLFFLARFINYFLVEAVAVVFGALLL